MRIPLLFVNLPYSRGLFFSYEFVIVIWKCKQSEHCIARLFWVYVILFHKCIHSICIILQVTPNLSIIEIVIGTVRWSSCGRSSLLHTHLASPAWKISLAEHLTWSNSRIIIFCLIEITWGISTHILLWLARGRKMKFYSTQITIDRILHWRWYIWV